MTTPRRLIDLEGMTALETKALMKPAFAEDGARSAFPELDATSSALFGLTADEAEAIARPEGWDGVDRRPVAEQVAAFEAEGWDVTDSKRRPLRTLLHFNQQLWLAIRGVAGTLPFQPDDPEPDSGKWGASLAADAKRFRRR